MNLKLWKAVLNPQNNDLTGTTTTVLQNGDFCRYEDFKITQKLLESKIKNHLKIAYCIEVQLFWFGSLIKTPIF